MNLHECIRLLITHWNSKVMMTLGIAALLVIGDLQSFKSGAIERRDKLLTTRLIPFSTYFDPEVDGTMTGPFYPLCPLIFAEENFASEALVLVRYQQADIRGT
jgi:hypothetical protein